MHGLKEPDKLRSAPSHSNAPKQGTCEPREETEMHALILSTTPIFCPRLHRLLNVYRRKPTLHFWYPELSTTWGPSRMLSRVDCDPTGCARRAPRAWGLSRQDPCTAAAPHRDRPHCPALQRRSSLLREPGPLPAPLRTPTCELVWITRLLSALSPVWVHFKRFRGTYTESVCAPNHHFSG